MNDTNAPAIHTTLERLGPQLREGAAAADREGRFVHDNYASLKDARFFSALVPTELGGGGVSHSQMCDALRQLAHYCSSTALAVSMHQHLVAATVWKYKRDQPGEALLRKVADGQLVLVSTGAGDWLNSNGEMQRVEGGYLVTARKHFASGGPAGDMIITTSRYDDPEQGPQVLHFPVPLEAKGVRSLEDWDAHGMRATGSNTLELEGVFVPDAAIALRRPQGQWHPAWNVVLTVAVPLYMAPYVGVAERAAELARDMLRKREADVYAVSLLGEMENSLVQAQLAFRDAVANANNYDFAPENERASAALARKTLVSKAAVATVERACEAVGGPSYFRRSPLEQLLRDVRASGFHPLPEKKQLAFTGRVALGLSPY